MAKFSRVFLGGFLSIPSDFQFCDYSIDFFSPQSVFQSYSLKDLAHCIYTDLNPSKTILIAYSFGARIALHILQYCKDFAGVILLSAHTGLSSIEDKKQRLKQDFEWAKRFENEEWKKLLEDWNAQSVFQGGKALLREESWFNRAKLAQSLREGSLGHQEDLKGFCRTLSCPTLWLYGEQDVKFEKIAKEVARLQNDCIHVKCISKASHRILLDQPEQVQILIQEFIQSL